MSDAFDSTAERLLRDQSDHAGIDQMAPSSSRQWLKRRTAAMSADT